MPIPAGQSCANCHYFVQKPGGTTTHGTCRFDKPTTATAAWPLVASAEWCGMWRAIGGSSGLQPVDVGVGYRGVDIDTGQNFSLDANWTLLTVSFASITNSRNFTLQSPGVIQLNYSTFTPSPTFEIYTTCYGICSFKSTTNNEAISITIGVNGTADPNYEVPSGVKTADSAVPVPTVAGLSLKNGDTVSLFARNPSVGTSNLIAYHILLEGFTVLTA